MNDLTIEQAVEECRQSFLVHDMTEEKLARLIAQAPRMYGLICFLLHSQVLSDNTLPRQYPALTRARSIVEAVTGQKHVWPDEEAEERKAVRVTCSYTCPVCGAEFPITLPAGEDTQ